MRRLCERPGCLGPAEVSYGIDNAQLTVWMDVLHVPDRGHTGHLCRRHADALAVPRGWTIDDRRQPIPQLFRDRGQGTDRGAGSDVAGGRGATRGGGRPRARRHGAHETKAELFAVVDDGHDPAPVVDPDETRAMAWSPSHVPAASEQPSGDPPRSGRDPDGGDPDGHESVDREFAVADDAAEPPVMGRLLGRAFRKNA